MIQGRVTDPTGTNEKGIWVSPERDIAHCLPILISQAFHRMETEERQLPAAKQQQAVTYAKAVAECVKRSVDPKVPTGDVYKKSALNADWPDWLLALVARNVMPVLLAAYISGIRVALQPGTKPIGIDTLLSQVNKPRRVPFNWRRALARATDTFRRRKHGR